MKALFEIVICVAREENPQSRLPAADLCVYVEREGTAYLWVLWAAVNEFDL